MQEKIYALHLTHYPFHEPSHTTRDTSGILLYTIRGITTFMNTLSAGPYINPAQTPPHIRPTHPPSIYPARSKGRRAPHLAEPFPRTKSPGPFLFFFTTQISTYLFSISSHPSKQGRQQAAKHPRRME